MTIDIPELTGVLRTLLHSYIDYPQDLRITWKQLPARVDWRVQANINDQGKLIGRQGTNIKAVKYLMREIGERWGEKYVVELEEGRGVRVPEIPRGPAPDGYDPLAQKQLLGQLVAMLTDGPVEIRVLHNGAVEDGRPAYLFEINAQDEADYERLVVSAEGDDDSQTVIAALGILTRAAGHRDGVSFRVEVPKR